MLPPAVDAERRQTHQRSGPLSYYVAGQGQPMLLVHSINAAGSVYEMRPVFEHMRDRYRVYAVDLPGFGFSDRSDRAYEVRLYVDAVHDMLDVIHDDRADEAVHVAALSLSCEFVARAATERAERFETLALITPTGFDAGAARLREDGTREVPGLAFVFEGRPWSRALFGLLTRKSTIRYFLRRTYGSRDVDEGMVEYDYRTTHQPGAEHAPYAFLSGRLFSKDIREVYERLERPVWLAHGTRGDFADFSEAAWTRARDDWFVDAFDTGAMPHFEQPQRFFAAYERFLALGGRKEAR